MGLIEHKMAYYYQEFTRNLLDFDPEPGSGNYQEATRNSVRPCSKSASPLACLVFTARNLLMYMLADSALGRLPKWWMCLAPRQARYHRAPRSPRRLHRHDKNKNHGFPHYGLPGQKHKTDGRQRLISKTPSPPSSEFN